MIYCLSIFNYFSIEFSFTGSIYHDLIVLFIK